ncbi:peptidoglycan editing factor PgeF [Variovorax saccharolyticus]|uniref:peptidoglycan editing factor PgeF n=1 Tax=Variovorax saccharolyticus TaxID=3053516 RepID=UPI00257867F0|nr:peptidoglycan editing factor PgeF [Variovorax sp. J31P216]MDM0023194.1 peptidoglycan editing factor PgeF [Variovorax sp. J31P216]
MPDWLLPDWPAPAAVRATCSTRAGGLSTGSFQGLNLGAHVGDDPAAVAANRAQFREAIGARPVFLQQVHGADVLPLGPFTVDGASADACTTTEQGIACTIMVADCLPVLFTDEAGQRVAAAHAGWRGLAAGVLENTVAAFQAEGGASKLLAWLGPCIGPDAFEVGDEVRAAFERVSPVANQFFQPAGMPGKWMADLAGLARMRLRAAGVEQLHGNDSSEAWCTVHNPLRFFSHRRDRVSGRFAACIWRA